MGWLAATPEIKTADGKTQRWTETRIERLQASGAKIPSVDIEAGQYLLTALREAGQTTKGEMGGERPLSWLELSAFAQVSGRIKHAWELRLIRELSAAFIEGKVAGTHPMAKPYEVE